MERRGTSYLPLHYGRPPEVLYKKIVEMTGYISEIICQTYGTVKFIELLSDPVWFHSLSLVTGFDWNSSGTTTTTLHALKEYSEKKDLSFFVAGGKGKHMRNKRSEILKVSEFFNAISFSEKLIRDTDLIARIDSNLLQDGYDLYIHCVVSDYSGNYSVVQQGLNPVHGLARRYHWGTLQNNINNLEERNGINASIMEKEVLDLSSPMSRDTRKSMLKIIREKPYFSTGTQSTLDSFAGEKVLNMAVKMPWEKLREIYEYEPSNIKELLFVKGIGKSAIRALSYISEVIMGTRPSMEDPVRYSFAVGGKDGIPKPVNHHDYDIALEFFSEVLRSSGIEREKRMKLIAQLSKSSLEKTGYTIISK